MVIQNSKDIIGEFSETSIFSEKEIMLNKGSEIVFMFPGYGEQHIGMAKELYENIQIFHDALNQCDKIVKATKAVSFIDFLYYSSDNQDSKNQLEKHSLFGVSLFAIEYSLAHTYIELGVKPSAMIGYSMGEWASACISGSISLEDTIFFILEQASYIETLPSGSMMAVPLSENEARKYLVANEVDLAAINSSKVCILSGTLEAIKKTKAIIRKDKHVESLILNSTYGFHSYLVEPIMNQVSQLAGKIKINTPKIKYISSLTGDWISENELIDSNYWARKLREPILFEQGIQKILNKSYRVLLEVGPRQTLSLLLKNHPEKQEEQIVLSSLPHLPESESDLTCFIATLKQLDRFGINISWDKVYQSKDNRDLS